MLVALLALGLAVSGCPTEDDDSSSSSGGGVNAPDALQGMWRQGSRLLRFTGTRWGGGPVTGDLATDDTELDWVITSAEGNKLEFQSVFYPAMDRKAWFNWEVSGTTLTISNPTEVNPDGSQEPSNTLSFGEFTRYTPE
jgi:hypothetical protein